MTAPLVLLVYDEPSIRRAFTRALQRFGFEVLGVPDAESALIVLGETRVDAVVMDLNLASTRGDALALAAIRRWPYLRGRIVMMSGDVSAGREWPEEISECPLLGKPFPIEALAERLRALIDQQAPAVRRHEQA